jgi:hypothetical protein
VGKISGVNVFFVKEKERESKKEMREREKYRERASERDREEEMDSERESGRRGWGDSVRRSARGRERPEGGSAVAGGEDLRRERVRHLR